MIYTNLIFSRPATQSHPLAAVKTYTFRILSLAAVKARYMRRIIRERKKMRQECTMAK